MVEFEFADFDLTDAKAAFNHSTLEVVLPVGNDVVVTVVCSTAGFVSEVSVVVGAETVSDVVTKAGVEIVTAGGEVD